MKEKDEQLPQDKDRHLDVPAEARRDNKINFLETDDTSESKNKIDDETKERQKQWKEGLNEGRKLKEGK